MGKVSSQLTSLSFPYFMDNRIIKIGPSRVNKQRQQNNSHGWDYNGCLTIKTTVNNQFRIKVTHANFQPRSPISSPKWIAHLGPTSLASSFSFASPASPWQLCCTPGATQRIIATRLLKVSKRNRLIKTMQHSARVFLRLTRHARPFMRRY